VGEVWQGSLTIQEGDAVVVTSHEEHKLCQNYGFPPTDGRMWHWRKMAMKLLKQLNEL
jgi:hypothetical protein